MKSGIIKYTFILLLNFLPVIFISVMAQETIILDQQRERSPREILTGDTLKFRIDTSQARELPGAREDTIAFTAEQDSAYKAALKLNIPVSTRLKIDLLSSETLWEAQKELFMGSKWALAQKTLNEIPREWYIPTNVQQMQHYYNIYYSQYVEGIRTMSPYGLKIPLSSIGSLLGLTEDVSPVITYEIDHPAEVEVVVYSVQAVVVATLFSGPQQPGEYTFTWNGRDDNGKKMPPGDYIGEVRIGKERYVRKRIKI